MTVLAEPPAASTTRVPRKGRLAELLVVGGGLVAPLNLELVRSLTVYDILVFAALALLLRDGRLRWPPRRYSAMGYVFVLAALLSAFRATYPTEALTQVLQYAFIFFVLLPVVISVVHTRRLVVLSLVMLCIGTLIGTVHAYFFGETQGAGRVLVFYSENPNRLGYPTAYLLPFLLVFWLLSRGRRPAVRAAVLLGCLVATYLSFWAVFASGSRSSLLGSAAALLVFFAVRPGAGMLRNLGRGLALAALVAALGYGLTASGQLPTTLQERVTRSLAAETEVEDQAGLIGDRENLAKAAVHAFVETPFVGTGLDNFRYVTTDYNLDATPQVPHNLWLQLLVQVGVFGTAAFALLLLFWVRDAVSAFRRVAAPDRHLLWGTVAAMAGILTIFMFAPEMLSRHYWLIIGLGLAVALGAVRENNIGGTP